MILFIIQLRAKAPGPASNLTNPFDGQKHSVPAHPTDPVNYAQAAEARTGDDGKHDVRDRELPMAIISIESAGHDFRRGGFDLRALVRAP
jgi:hypothetical protein